MHRYHILIVEDEFIPANYIKKTLQKEGHTVVGIANSKDSVLDIIHQNRKIDLVLMDIKILGLDDGISIAKMLQEYGNYAILYISAYSDSGYLQRAKDSHTIGYLVKPIQPNTLLSTIEIGMAQFYEKHTQDRITFCDNAFYDRKEQCIHINDKVTVLSVDEALILDLMLEHKNQILTMDKLESTIYQDAVVTKGALRTQIWRLRKKLPSCVAIETVYNAGYKIKF